MELSPYISVQAPPAALSAGAIVAGLVKEILGQNQYAVQIQAITLQLDLPLLLQPGDTVRLKIREATARGLVIDVALPDRPGSMAPASPRQLLERLDLPADADSERLVRTLLKMNAPIERDRVEAALAAVKTTKGEARFEAAAFLVAHGIDPEPALVAKLARIAAPEEIPYTAAASPVIQSYQPEPIPEGGPVQPQPMPVSEALQKVIEASLPLRILDRAIELVSSAASVEGDRPLEPALAAVLDAVNRREELPEKFSQLLALPAAKLRELRGRLLEVEHSVMSSMPELRDARESRGTVFDSYDRAFAHRLINQLARINDERIAVFEVPVRHDGRVVRVPVRVVRREGGAKPGQPAGFHLTIDTDLSRLGPVRTRVEAAGPSMSVRFQVRRADTRRLLESGNRELADDLAALGWKAGVTTEIATPPPETPFTPFEGTPTYLGVDVRA